MTWLKTSSVSPVTGEPLTHMEIFPNMTLRRLATQRVEVA